jgi:hypothetical protein
MAQMRTSALAPQAVIRSAPKSRHGEWRLLGKTLPAKIDPKQTSKRKASSGRSRLEATGLDVRFGQEVSFGAGMPSPVATASGAAFG